MILIAEENISESIREKGNLEMPPIIEKPVITRSEENKEEAKEEAKEEVKTD